MTRRVAVITGGGSGIGWALTETLLKQDWKVYLASSNLEKLEAAQAHDPERIAIIQADLAELDAAEHIAQGIEEDKIDILVHNSAIIDPMVAIQSIQAAQYERIMRINVTACLLLTQKLLSRLQGARVLFISSGAAKHALHQWAPYCISKAALKMLKLCFQAEIKDVAFSDVRPGIVNTPMIQHVLESKFEGNEFFQELESSERLLEPSVVGQFLNWILTQVDTVRFAETEWDIYDESHHHEWLKGGIIPSID